MAKPFYSMEEVCEKLGKSQDEIKELVRDGTLREFRDAGKIFFKAEDVDKLSGEGASGDSGEVLLEPADEGGDADLAADSGDMPSLVSSSGGTSIIGLEPLEDEAASDGGGEEEQEKEDTVITASGIGVFDDDELEIDADPMAKTQITESAIDDQVSLESSGSGSGLLDLTRESDDTSLGAELLDEIYPGEEEAVEAEPATEPEAEAEAEAEEEEQELAAVDTGETLAPVIVATGDPSEGLFSGFLVATLILIAISSAVIGGVIQGYLPDYTHMLTDNFWILLGGSTGVLVLSIVVGWFLGKALTPKRG